MEITGLEANLLLAALDEFVPVDSKGKIYMAPNGYTPELCQSLRDRLFAVHEHPDDE